MLRFATALLLVCLSTLPVRAQSTIQASVIGVPPLLRSPFIAALNEDYDAGRYLLQVNVIGAQPVTAALRLTVRRNGQSLLTTTSSPVQFAPGMTTYRRFSDPPSLDFNLSPDQVIERFPAQERNAILQSGALPEGVYTFDVEPVVSGETIAIPGTTTFEVRSPDPPTLVAPTRDEEVPQAPVFIWTPVVTQAGTGQITYRIRLVEMLPGQSPARAMASNRPMLDERVSGQTTFPYTPDLLPLERTKRYAWNIVAATEGVAVPIRDGGASEVETFVYLPAEVAPPADILPPVVETPLIAGSGGAGGTSVTPPTYQPPFTIALPEVRVTGRVAWGIAGGRSVPLPDTRVLVSGIVGSQRQTLTVATTDAQGQFTIALADLSLAGAALYGSRPSALELRGVAPAQTGAFVGFAPVSLTLPASGSTDAGTLMGTVQTFRVAVAATDARTRASLSNVTVTPLRTEQHVRELAVLALEGDGGATSGRFSTPDGTTALVPTAAPATGRTALLLLPPELAPAWVLVRAPGYYDRIVPVPVASTPGEVSLSVALSPSGVTFAGRLVRADNGAALPDLRVTVRAGGAQYEARSDSEGHFELQGVERTDGLARLTVVQAHRPVYIEDFNLRQSGPTVTRDPIRVTTDPIVVVGVVFDEEDRALTGASVTVSGPAEQLSMTDDDGQFTLALPPGAYTMGARKSGFDPRTFQLTVTPEGEGTVRPAGGLRGYQPPLRLGAERLSAFEARGDTAGFAGLGTPDERRARYGSADPLVMRTIRFGLTTSNVAITVKVQDSRGRALANIGVTTEVPTSLSTRTTVQVMTLRNGSASMTVPKNISLTFRACPCGGGGVSSYAQASVSKTVTSAFTTITLTLLPGPQITGDVYLGPGTRGLGGATVTLEGLESVYQTTTNAAGRFTLEGVPQEMLNVVVSKQGYVTTKISADRRTAQNAPLVVRLVPQPPPPPGQPTITSLLGFPVKVTQIVAASNGFRISGTVTSAPSNSVFGLGSTSLPFADQYVEMQNGAAVPPDGRITLSASTLALTAFGIPVTLRSPSLRSDGSSTGTLIGSALELNVGSAFARKVGWAAGQAVVNLALPGAPAGVVAVLPSSGQLTGITSLPFTQALALTVQGVTLQANALSALNANGLALAGELRPAGFPTGRTLPVTSLLINKGGDLGQMVIGTVAPLTYDAWTLTTSSARLADGGVLLGGTLQMPMTGRATFNSTFADLRVTQDGLFGGRFTLAGNQLTLFDQVAFKMPAPSTFSFGYEDEDGKRVYGLEGAGTIELGRNTYFTAALPVKEFKVLSTGDFEGTADVGFRASFAGVAQYELESLTYGNTVGNGGTLGLKLDGELAIDFPKATATVGAITFMPGNRIHVDEVEVEADLANIGKIKVAFAFLNGTSSELPETCGDVAEGSGNATGFCGAGEFELKKLGEFDVGVHYIKRTGGTTFGGSLVVGTPPIPLGTTGLMLSRPGVGFSYNLSNKNFLVSVQGDVTVGTPEAGTGLQPLKLAVASGPVFTGTADVFVVKQAYGNASLSLDMDKKLFMASISLTGKNLYPATTLSGNATITFSGGASTYWFMGAQVSAETADFFKANAIIAVGSRYPVTANTGTQVYTNAVPASYRADGFINGLHLSAQAFVGGGDYACRDWHGFELCSFAHATAQAKLNKSFTRSDFDFEIGGNWVAKARIRYSIAKVSAGLAVNGMLRGGFTDYNGWKFKGDVQGYASISAGTDCRCNSICAIGGKLCASAGATVGWQQRNPKALSMSVYAF